MEDPNRNGSPGWGVGERLKTAHGKNVFVQKSTQGLGIGLIIRNDPCETQGRPKDI